MAAGSGSPSAFACKTIARVSPPEEVPKTMEMAWQDREAVLRLLVDIVALVGDLHDRWLHWTDRRTSPWPRCSHVGEHRLEAASTTQLVHVAARPEVGGLPDTVEMDEFRTGSKNRQRLDIAAMGKPIALSGKESSAT